MVSEYFRVLIFFLISPDVRKIGYDHKNGAYFRKSLGLTFRKLETSPARSLNAVSSFGDTQITNIHFLYFTFKKHPCRNVISLAFAPNLKD